MAGLKRAWWRWETSNQAQDDMGDERSGSNRHGWGGTSNRAQDNTIEVGDKLLGSKGPGGSGR